MEKNILMTGVHKIFESSFSWQSLTPEDKESLSFTDLLRIWKHNQDVKNKNEIWDLLKERAKNFEERKILWAVLDFCESKEQEALGNLIRERVEDFSEAKWAWENTIFKIEDRTKSWKLLKEKIRKLEEAKLILNLTFPGSREREEIMVLVKQMEKNKK